MKKVLLCLCLLSTGLSQTVTDSTTTFFQARTPTGVTMTDFLADQATGQGADDLVVNGIYLKYGLANGVYTQFVRAVFNSYQAKGFGGNFKVGIDANGDGSLDLVYGIVDSGSNKGIVTQVPTTGAVSTGSTSLGSPTSVTPFTSSNYSYTVMDFTPTNAMLTFAIPFSTIQSSLAAQGITVDVNTFMRSIFFTATNQGAINQDIYGVSGINNTLRFDSEGGFTEYQSFTGSIPVVPEPETYMQVGAMLLVIGIMKYRKRNK